MRTIGIVAGVVLIVHDVVHDIKIYPSARHSFFNDRGRAFHPQPAADVWARPLAF